LYRTEENPAVYTFITKSFDAGQCLNQSVKFSKVDQLAVNVLATTLSDSNIRLAS